MLEQVVDVRVVIFEQLPQSEVIQYCTGWQLEVSGDQLKVSSPERTSDRFTLVCTSDEQASASMQNEEIIMVCG